MSRNLLPAVLAIGVGVFSGYYTFQPIFQQLAAEKTHSGQARASDNAGNAQANGGTMPAVKSTTTDSRPDGDKCK